ncbi:archaellin/type IV pilin N-terminal domain-containing protein [Infirmifilum sp.]|uniref:archaellin/type IV pilin N-terminal domain-containing protein n=1 Tax=Infirmifilum sp. TaxID=2856575 RepID=UPI003D134247
MGMKRRAISPVIATLLLIVIAVAAAVLTYIWLTGYMGTITPHQTPTQLQERVKIDAVQVDNTGVYIYVANIGDVDTSIVGAYVLTLNYTAVCGGSISKPLPKGSTAQVQVPGTCTLTSGKTYIAKVTAKQGSEATYTFVAP